MVVLRNKRKKMQPRKRGVPPAPVAKQEVSALGKAIRALGGVIGSAGGAALGVPIAGGSVGTSLGGALSRWLGAGDYTVGANTVVTKSLKAASSIPSMHNGAQSIVVRHREYLGEVRSSTAFSVQQSFPLNPGNASTFPWLSGIATRFQEFTIKGAVFHYIPTSGSAVSSTNAALGSVMLQTSYRATDVPPSSKVEMLNEYCSNEVVPCDSMAHPIECDPKENPFNVMYIRSGAIPAGENLLMYDLGVTHLAVSGCQTTGNVIGDLWVTYEIELKKPLIASNVTYGTLSSGATLTGVGLTLPLPFGTVARTLTGSLAAVTLNNTITIPKGSVGKYQVWVAVAGSTLVATYGSTVFTNCVEAQMLTGQNNYANLSGASLVDFCIAFEVLDPAVTPVITLALGGSSASITSTRITITDM
jgi:hypothetical protein